MCSCRQACCDVVDSGIVHFSFTEEDLRPPRMEDGLHAFVRIMRRETKERLYIRITLADVVDGELLGLVESDVLANESYFRDRANGILPFDLEIEIHEPTEDHPVLAVGAEIRIPKRGTFQVEDSVSFEVPAKRVGNTTSCFWIERRCVADEYFGQGWHWLGGYRCEKRVHYCDGTYGPWTYDGPFCGWGCPSGI